MERTEGFYWVYGYKWSTKPSWFVAHWHMGSWWYDGDDFSDDVFIEIDEIIIKHNINNIKPPLSEISATKIKHTYSYDQYEGHDNEKIISLHDELNNCENDLHRIKQEIINIQNNCSHEYMFNNKGVYETCYICKKCGHETWK